MNLQQKVAQQVDAKMTEFKAKWTKEMDQKVQRLVKAESSRFQKSNLVSKPSVPRIDHRIVKKQLDLSPKPLSSKRSNYDGSAARGTRKSEGGIGRIQSAAATSVFNAKNGPLKQKISLNSVQAGTKPPNKMNMMRSVEPRPMTTQSKLMAKKSRSPGIGSPSKKFKPDFAPQSATEEVDDPIYSNKDPVAVSMKQRLAEGSILSVVRVKKQPYFFNLKLNGKGKTNKEFTAERQ